MSLPLPIKKKKLSASLFVSGSFSFSFDKNLETEHLHQGFERNSFTMTPNDRLDELQEIDFEC